MTVRYDFVLVPETLKVIDNEFQIVVVQGNTGDVISRTEKEEVNELREQTFDSESSNIIKHQTALCLIEGGFEMSLSWENENDISESDIERFLSLTENDYLKNGSFTERSVAETLANKEYKATYVFGNNYETLQEKGFSWGLYGKRAYLKATQDHTKFVCFQPTVPNYVVQILDIGVGENKTINKSDNLMYLFFSQNCSIAGTQISQYDIKRLNSSSVEITNESETTARILIYKR